MVRGLSERCNLVMGIGTSIAAQGLNTETLSVAGASYYGGEIFAAAGIRVGGTLWNSNYIINVNSSLNVDYNITTAGTLSAGATTLASLSTSSLTVQTISVYDMIKPPLLPAISKGVSSSEAVITFASMGTSTAFIVNFCGGDSTNTVSLASTTATTVRILLSGGATWNGTRPLYVSIFRKSTGKLEYVYSGTPTL
jgi:hypothetical protein